MSLQASIRATWRRVPLAASSPLPRSSQNLYFNGSDLLVFGGEIKPRQPVDASIHAVSPVQELVSDGESSKEVTWSTLSESSSPCPAPRVGACGVKGPQGEWYIWSGRGGKDMAPLEYGEQEDLWVWEGKSWKSIQTTGDKPEMRSYATAARSGQSLFIHAGCPVKGRLGTLHKLDLPSKKWTVCAEAPREGRGGTVIAAVRSAYGQDERLLRWGGFCGHELGGPLDIYDIAKDAWTSVDVPIEGSSPGIEPPKRSVHGLSALSKPIKVSSDKSAVAVLFLGEGEGAPKELGHDGAGKFLNDVWLLLEHASSGSFSWLSVEPQVAAGGKLPEARGWFAFDAAPLSTTGTRIALQGGLNEQNQRLDDAWLLDIEAAS